MIVRFMETVFEIMLLGVFGFMMKRMIDQTFEVAGDLLNNSLTAVMGKAEGWIKGLSEVLVGVIATGLTIATAGVGAGLMALPQIAAVGLKTYMGSKLGGLAGKMGSMMPRGVFGEKTSQKKMTSPDTNKKNPLAKGYSDPASAPASSSVPSTTEVPAAAGYSPTTSPSSAPQSGVSQTAASQTAAKSSAMSDTELAVETSAQQTNIETISGDIQKIDEQTKTNDAIIKDPLSPPNDIARAEQNNQDNAILRNTKVADKERIEGELRTKQKATADANATKAAERKATAEAHALALKEQLSGTDVTKARTVNSKIDQYANDIERNNAIVDPLKKARVQAKAVDDGTLAGKKRSDKILKAAERKAAIATGSGGRTDLAGKLGGLGGLLTNAIGPLGESRAFKRLTSEVTNAFTPAKGGFDFMTTPKALDEFGSRTAKSLGTVGDMDVVRRHSVADAEDFFWDGNEEAQKEIKDSADLVDNQTQTKAEAEAQRLAAQANEEAIRRETQAENTAAEKSALDMEAYFAAKELENIHETETRQKALEDTEPSTGKGKRAQKKELVAIAKELDAILQSESAIDDEVRSNVGLERIEAKNLVDAVNARKTAGRPSKPKDLARTKLDLQETQSAVSFNDKLYIHTLEAYNSSHRAQIQASAMVDLLSSTDGTMLERANALKTILGRFKQHSPAQHKALQKPALKSLLNYADMAPENMAYDMKIAIDASDDGAITALKNEFQSDMNTMVEAINAIKAANNPSVTREHLLNLNKKKKALLQKKMALTLDLDELQPEQKNTTQTKV